MGSIFFFYLTSFFYKLLGGHVERYRHCSVPILGALTFGAWTLVLQKDIYNGKLSLSQTSIGTHRLQYYLPLLSFVQICYFFYKNVTFGFTVFLYEAYASFSGQPAYNDWFLSLYNVFFTSLPVIALGVFDQDVSARFCLKVRPILKHHHRLHSIFISSLFLIILHKPQFPLLYQEGVQNALFSWRRIIGWMLNGVVSAVIIFFLCMRALGPQSFNKDGKIADRQIVGATMYTCVVWVVNCQMALAISYFTLIQHVVIWGGVALWYLFLLAYGAMPPSISTTAYKVFAESLAPNPSFYIVTIFVVISALVPYTVYNAIQMRFFPMYHGMVQWIRHDGRCEDPEYCNMVRQRSIRSTTVGFTARSLVRTNPLDDRNPNQRQC